MMRSTLVESHETQLLTLRFFVGSQMLPPFVLSSTSFWTSSTSFVRKYRTSTTSPPVPPSAKSTEVSRLCPALEFELVRRRWKNPCGESDSGLSRETSSTRPNEPEGTGLSFEESRSKRPRPVLGALPDVESRRKAWQ